MFAQLCLNSNSSLTANFLHCLKKKKVFEKILNIIIIGKNVDSKLKKKKKHFFFATIFSLVVFSSTIQTKAAVDNDFLITPLS